MKSITSQSHTLSEALDRMRAKVLKAEAQGEKVVSIGVEDVPNLKEAAFRCNDYARIDNAQHEAFMDGVQRERISAFQSASKWAKERGHDEFSDYLSNLAADWEAREEKRKS